MSGCRGTDASDGYYDVDYTWAKAVAGRNTLRKATMVLPEGSTLTYEYLSTNSLHDNDASRVTRVKVATTAVASYAYNGATNLVRAALLEPDVFMLHYNPADLDDYDRLDRFGRVTQSKWTKDLATDVDFYHTSITWDRNGNVTLIEDNIHTGFDVQYTNDNINRLTKAEEGTWGGSSISSRTREQNWTLDQVGNWYSAKLDLDGDNNWNETDEYNDTRTHDVVNQLNARNTDSTGGDEFTLTYDGVGNLTDDGQAYEYVYDVWGRLRKVKNTSNQSLIAEYWYNGLGFRITFHEDADSDGDVDANDPKYHLIYDERWRHIATYRADDDNPKELFVYHQAGLDGQGGSSYIDSVILRQRDANSGWTSAADGTLEERRYYCQDWRADVSAIITSGGLIVEWAKYSAYGVPFGLPGADTDSDGDCDSTDITQIQTWIDAPAYDVRGDINLDGDVDATDKTLAINNYQGTTSGWNVLSAVSVANRIGYAGYHKDVNLDISHVRNRVLDPHLGRWTRRDPLGYVDGMSLYEYVAAKPTVISDPSGLRRPDTGHDLREYYPIAPFAFGDVARCSRVSGNAYERCMCEHKWGTLKCTSAYFKCVRWSQQIAKGAFTPGDNRDAYRHCLWSCCMKKHYGDDFARDIGNRHEEAHKGKYHPCQDAMDYYNNAIGRNCSKQDCRSCCLRAWRRRRLITDWTTPDRRICNRYGCVCVH